MLKIVNYLPHFRDRALLYVLCIPVSYLTPGISLHSLVIPGHMLVVFLFILSVYRFHPNVQRGDI